MSKENGKEYDDDITIIWRDTPCGFDSAYENDLPIRELVNYYAGEYDYDDTEYYIKKYYEEKLKQKEQPAPKKPKTMDLPICYVNLISDCLEIIKKHNLYALLSYDGDAEIAEDHVVEVFECFCKPLEEQNEDLKIILED
jgi:hypothetical protein